jgi:DNA polymerase III epsilon subunit-like protein
MRYYEVLTSGKTTPLHLGRKIFSTSFLTYSHAAVRMKQKPRQCISVQYFSVTPAVQGVSGLKRSGLVLMESSKGKLKKRILTLWKYAKKSAFTLRLFKDAASLHILYNLILDGKVVTHSKHFGRGERDLYSSRPNIPEFAWKLYGQSEKYLRSRAVIWYTFDMGTSWIQILTF